VVQQQAAGTTHKALSMTLLPDQQLLLPSSCLQLRLGSRQ
jgi:hypothetical protein